MLRECSQRNDWDCRIDVADGASEQIGCDSFASGSKRAKPNEIGNVALKSTCERQINSADRLLRLKQRVARRRNDPDDLNGLILSVGIGSTLLVSILNALSKRVTIRPEFLCQDFVNNRDPWTGLSCLRFSEHATTSYGQSNG